MTGGRSYFKDKYSFASYHGSVVGNGSFNIQDVIEGNVTLEKQRDKNEKLELLMA